MGGCRLVCCCQKLTCALVSCFVFQCPGQKNQKDWQRQNMETIWNKHFLLSYCVIIKCALCAINLLHFSVFINTLFTLWRCPFQSYCPGAPAFHNIITLWLNTFLCKNRGQELVWLFRRNPGLSLWSSIIFHLLGFVLTCNRIKSTLPALATSSHCMSHDQQSNRPNSTYRYWSF